MPGVADPHPQQPSGTDGVEGLDGLVPRALRIGKGVDPILQAAHGIGHRSGDQNRYHYRPDQQAAAQHEPADIGAPHKHHHDPDGQDQDRSRQMRFQEHQKGNRSQDPQKWPYTVPGILHSVVVHRDHVGKDHHHREFRQFGGLEGGEAQVDPPLGILTAGDDQHNDQQCHCCQKNQHRKPV